MALLSKIENQYVHKIRRSKSENAASIRREAFGRISNYESYSRGVNFSRLC
ncbi:MAG: hypothetical protein ACLPWD_00060 [Methanobacterium sp.]